MRGSRGECGRREEDYSLATGRILLERRHKSLEKEMFGTTKGKGEFAAFSD